jgi:hypothetical protein
MTFKSAGVTIEHRRNAGSKPAVENIVSAPDATTSTLETQLNLSLKGYWTGIIVGLLILFMFARKEIFQLSEYAPLYAGARLVGTPDLYDKTRNQQEQMLAVGAFGGDELIYSRPPFVAAFMAPLGKLPYRVSVLIFQALSFLALIGFILLWPNSNRWLTALACAWSLPMALVFAVVREDTLLLLLLALTFRLYKQRPLIAGILMSLLGIKFHLFLLLPLLIIGQRRWRMAAGFVTGCASLIGISFAVAGFDWPVRMAQIIKTSTIPKQYLLPNIRGILQSVTDNLIPEVIIGIIVAAVVLRLVSRSGFEYGMCAAIVGSLLVSHHAGIYDCVLLIPVLLILGGNGETKSATWCFVLLSPAPYALLSFGGVPGLLVKFGIVSLLALIHLQMAHRTSWVRASAGELQPSWSD